MSLNESEDTFKLYTFPNQQKRIRLIEWQTWSFTSHQPKVGWSCGICESEDFHYSIKSSIEQAGQTPFWREISIS